MNNLPDDLKDFVHSMIDEYIKDQTKRFPAGVQKYGNHIINDYTIEEHIANLKEEHRDADAYTKAIEILVGKLRAENEQLKAKIENALNICEEDNGIRACKNCGLGVEDE